MALSIAATWPLGIARTARFASRHVRATVVISLILICGSFAAAAALSMRFDRVHALNQASVFEQRRARDLAAVVSAALDRMERQGRAFAEGRLTAAPDGVRNIAVYGPDGTAVSTLTGANAFVRLPREVVAAARGQRILIGSDGLATTVSAYGSYVVAVAFDAHVLAPAGMLERAGLTVANGLPLLGAGGGTIQARAHGWPVTVSVTPDDDGALAAWTGSLPLYLFVILGPALVGAWLASIFVGEFERRRRAESLKARPADAQLLVRLAQAEREAVEAQRSKAEFIAHMSHELRTPLNAVIGFSEIIEGQMFGPAGHAKYVEYAHDIGTAGRGLHGKIGDILEYANLEAGRYPVRLSTFDLAELAGTLVDEQVGRAFSRRIGLDFVAHAPAPVCADANAVKRILSCLIANALAFTPEGGRVRVSLTAEEGAVAVQVADTGPGFKPEEAKGAGNAFRRFDRQGGQTGQGLGLAIAVQLARRTGGALTLASSQGQGTKTELRLPKAA
ncbi:MAG: HAMP domain-containing histidine kinase [Alphaproteobacteria bacterium]|nr:HAMP domain-containing histidine kinase [Alphaproteobacteria bacterium]